MKIYEINNQLQQLFEQMDIEASENDGVISDSLMHLLDLIQIEKDSKLLDIARYVKQLEYEVKAIKDEELKLADRRTGISKKIASLEDFLQFQLGEGNNLKDANTCMSWRKSQRVVIEVEVDKLPVEYVRAKTSIEPDKKAIKDSIESGNMVDGCRLEVIQNLQIK